MRNVFQGNAPVVKDFDFEKNVYETAVDNLSSFEGYERGPPALEEAKGTPEDTLINLLSDKVKSGIKGSKLKALEEEI